MTRVVAVSGSPKMDRGNTERILRPFLEGTREGGAEVEVFYAKKLDIQPCRGELLCWGRNLGKCHIKDDMQKVYPALRRADIMVLATPVYIPLPGEMQNFLNRLVPLMNPLLARKNGRTRARFHSDVRIKKIVLVSSSGWWEKENLGTVLRIAKELAKDCNVEFAGALLRPHSSLLAKKNPKVDRVLAAARDSGRELVSNGKIPRKLLDLVAEPLISEEDMWKSYE